MALGLSLLLSLTALACKGEGDEPPPSRAEDERTVVTLQSYVYAAPDDTGFEIAARIRDQIRSSFGGLKSLRVTGSNKELSNGAEEQLYKEPLVMIGADGEETIVLRVWFRYTDEVFAPAWIQRGVPILVGGLHRQDEARFTEMVNVCTANTTREREFRGRLQAVFDGSLPGCQEAMLGEQSRIDAARVRLDSPEDEIVPEEFGRIYVPVVARLLGRKASQMGRYPRFEAVVPQAGRSVLASAPAGGRPAGVGASTDPAVHEVGHDDGSEVTGRDRPDPTVVGAAGPGRVGPPSDEESDPDAPPDPQAGIPVIAAGEQAKSSPAAVVQPRRGDGEGAFNWEDLTDSKYWVLWLAVLALYPLLKRRPTDG